MERIIDPDPCKLNLPLSRESFYNGNTSILVLIGVLSCSKESLLKMLSILSSHTMLLPIELLLQIMLNNVLNNSYCITFVLEEKINIRTSLSFIDIFTNGSNYKQFVEQILEASEMGCSDFVVKMREPALFMKALDEATHKGLIRRSDKKLVIIPWDEYSDWLNILSMKETSFVPNILLITPTTKNISECTGFDLVTHKYVGPDETSVNPMYLDSWNSCTMRFEKNENMFPHNMSNLYGKTVKMTAVAYSPNTILDLDTTIVPSGRDGIEIRIVDEFCVWLNCTIKVTMPSKDEPYGEVYNNITGIGLLGNIVKDHADLGIPAFCWYNAFRWLDFSAYSLRTGVTAIVPAPRLLVKWDMPLWPFSGHMWIGMLLTFLLNTLAVIIAQRSDKKAFLTTFGLLTGQTVVTQRSSWRIRIATGCLVLTGLVLCNAYSAGMSSTYTVPKLQDPIDTVQDLVDRQMEWGARDISWVFSISLSPDPLEQELIRLLVVLDTEELKNKTFLRKMAFGVGTLPSGHFAIGKHITHKVVSYYRIMKDDFYHDYTAVMLRKSSPYTQKINTLILRLHQSGLILAFETQVALKYLDYKVQLAVKLSRSKKSWKSKPLSLRHVVGIFYFYMIGVGVSLLIFIIEVVIGRGNK